MILQRFFLPQVFLKSSTFTPFSFLNQTQKNNKNSSKISKIFPEISQKSSPSNCQLILLAIPIVFWGGQFQQTPGWSAVDERLSTSGIGTGYFSSAQSGQCLGLGGWFRFPSLRRGRVGFGGEEHMPNRFINNYRYCSIIQYNYTTSFKVIKCSAGWWLPKYFLFSPLPWEMIQFDKYSVQMGWNHHLECNWFREISYY